jgi:hypothetical protein
LSHNMVPVLFRTLLFASVFLDILFCSHMIITVKIVVFWVMTVCSMVCGWLALLARLGSRDSTFLQNVGNHLLY